MIAILDSMVNVIDPEMPRQIAKWGGALIMSGSQMYKMLEIL